MYRKIKHSAGTETGAPIAMASQLQTEKLKLSYKTHHSTKESLSHPDPPKNPHKENLPCEGRPGVGANPNPTHKEGPTIKNWKAPDTLLSNRYAPQALETRGKVRLEGQQNQME